MIGRKIWLSHEEESAKSVIHPDNEAEILALKNYGYEDGRFLTEAELEQLIRKAVEMARSYYMTDGGYRNTQDDIVKELMK